MRGRGLEYFARDKGEWWEPRIKPDCGKNRSLKIRKRNAYNYNVDMNKIIVQNSIPILERISTRFILGIPKKK